MDRKQRGRIENLLVLAATGIFAADLCFVAPTIFQGCDYVLMWKPIWRFFADTLREGAVPLWNPYIGLGRPFLADMQNAVFYPPVYLIFLGQRLGPFLIVWLHCALAVVGLRRLGDCLQAGRAQSYFMALCFVGSGALTARWMTGQIPICWALSYAPWLLYCAMRTIEPWSLRRVAFYALVLTAQFLCGNPQIFWFCAIGQGAFILGRAARFPVRDAVTDAWRSGSQFAVAFVWCLGLVAAQLLPFLELVQHANRNAPTPEFANFLKLKWEHFSSLVAPLGISSHYPWINWEMNLFVGWIVVVTGFAGLCYLRERNVRGLLAVGVAGLLIAVGNSTPAFWLFYHWLPGFATFRIHARAAFLIVFVLICGSGIWLSRPHPRLNAMWMQNFDIPVRYLFAGVVLLQIFVLAHATQQIKTAYSFENIFHYHPDFPLQNALVARLHEADLMQKWQPPPRVFAPPWLIPPNDAMIYRFSDVDANFSLFLRRDWDYLHHVLGFQPPELLNTGLRLAVYERGPFPYRDLSVSAGIDATNETINLATNPSPRAFVVYAAEVINYDAILARLASGYDIHRSALLEKPLPSRLQPDSGFPATVADIKRFELNSLLVDEKAKENGLLVLAEAWYPGWRAAIDGQDCACMPANIWMRSVPVPAGYHQVRFYFHQDYLLAGVLVSATSACLLLIVLLRTKAVNLRKCESLK